MSEAVKYGDDDTDRITANYIQNLVNLGKAEIKTVCYNFMPVIDWIRTNLEYPLPDGSLTLFMDKIRFVYFDCFTLRHEGAENDYTPQEIDQTLELGKTISDKEKRLSSTRLSSKRKAP